LICLLSDILTLTKIGKTKSAEGGLKGWGASPKEICEANLPKPAKAKSFLIEKFLSPALIKVKIFAGFDSRRQPTSQRRWAGLLPRGQQLKVSIRTLFKIGSNFVQKAPLVLPLNQPKIE